jgi:alanine dehydrogenase
MSEFAGRMSIQVGAASLQKVNEGYSGVGLPTPTRPKWLLACEPR